MPWSLQDLVLTELRALDPKPDLIIEGGATGADSIAKVIAIYLGIPWLELAITEEERRIHKKAAGRVRNQRMLAEKPDLVVAFQPSTRTTPGTTDMIRRAGAAGVPVKTVIYEEKL
jgi:hypothetical protein